MSAILSDAQDATPDIDFLVVGAMARDLLLHYGHGVPIARATTDIDFGLAVADWEEFQKLRDTILSSEHFTSGSQVTVLFIAAVSRSTLSLLVELRDDGTIMWPEDDSVMGVLGYAEARASAVDMIARQAVSRNSLLAMLAILKLMDGQATHVYTEKRCK